MIKEKGWSCNRFRPFFGEGAALICRKMSNKIAKYTIKCRKALETLPVICYNIK